MTKITPTGPDPTEVASNVYKKVFENQLIRVFDVRFKPGDKAEMHWHPNHFAYVIEGGDLEITPPSGEVMKMASKAGDSVWMDSGHHEAKNPGKQTLHVLVVEFKGNTSKIGT